MAAHASADEAGHGGQQFDYCMVFRAHEHKLSPEAEGIVKTLLKVGFTTKSYLSYQRDEILVLLTCPANKLAAFADLIDYKMYLDEQAVQLHAERGCKERMVPPLTVPHNPAITPRRPYEFIYGKVSFAVTPAAYGEIFALG